ncbi:hypothetical protein LINPERHAP2_LOCUS1026 [Linum perenne]
MPTNNKDSRVPTLEPSTVTVELPPADEYGPWLTVSRKGRRPRQEGNSEKGKYQKRNVEGSFDPPKSAGSAKGEISGTKVVSEEEASQVIFNAKSNKDSSPTGVLFKERKGKQGNGKANTDHKQAGPEAGKSPVNKRKDHNSPASAKPNQSRPNPPKETQTEQTDPDCQPAGSSSAPQDPAAPLNGSPIISNGLFPPPPPLTDPPPRQPLTLRRSKKPAPNRRIPPTTKPKKAPGKKTLITASTKDCLKDWIPPKALIAADTEVHLSPSQENDSVKEPALIVDETMTDETDQSKSTEVKSWDLNSPSET